MREIKAEGSSTFKPRRKVTLKSVVDRKISFRFNSIERLTRIETTRVSTDTLVVSKNERPVFYAGAARRASKWITFKRRDRRPIKKVSRIERAVAQKLEYTSMKLIRPGPRNRIDHAFGSSSILRRRVACQNRKFLDNIDAQVSAKDVSRPAIGIVVYANAIQTVIILLRAASGNADLGSKVARPSIRS